MKIRKKALILCVAFVTTVLLTACGGGYDFLVGRWEIVERYSTGVPTAQAPILIDDAARVTGMDFEFFSDFTGVILIYRYTLDILKHPFTWSRIDGKLTLIQENANDIIYGYEFSDSTLRLALYGPFGNRTTNVTVLQRAI